jgi:hypothetical protein
VPNAGGRPDVVTVSRYAKPVAGQHFDGISFADERLEFGMSMDKVKAVCFDMRAHFDFVVVDTSQLLRSDLAVLFSTVADGTLLTLRLGRLPSAADEETVKTLTRLAANVLGVLTVSSSVIKEFNAQRAAVFETIRIPTRHVTSHHALVPETPREVAVETSRSNVVS